MSRRLIPLASAVLFGMLGLGVASACLPAGSQTIIEFEPGSVVMAGTAAHDLEEAHGAAISFSRHYRVLVRGYADAGTETDPALWKPEDLALADARARALSEAMRRDGDARCVDRIAVGYALHDWRTARINGEPYGLAGGVVVLAPPDSKEPSEPGVPIERDCGHPGPAATPTPSP